MAHLPRHCCGFWRTWGDVRNTEAMVPEPNDDPQPDDDEEIDDEADEEPDDEADEEPDNDPGTLYFRGDDGWTGQSC